MSSIDRRTFLTTLKKTATAGAVTCGGLGVLAYMQRNRLLDGATLDETSVLRPPGAIDEERFLSLCMRCTRCMDACPSGSIQLAGPDNRAELGTPFVAASDVGCTLCLECTLTCPSGALEAVHEKEDVRMGLAVVDERTCVSHNGSGVCGACHTACPFRNEAITQGMRNAPTVHEDYCVGCGLCEEACILKGVKAIRVESGRAAV